MKNKFISRSLLAVICGLAAAPLFAQRVAVEDPLASRINSQVREQVMQEFVKYKVEARVDLRDSQAMKDLRDEIESAGIQLQPSKPIDARSEADIQKDVRDLLRKEFKKSPDAIEKETRTEIEKRLPPINVNENVSVRYTRNNRGYEAKGVFHGFADNNTKVRIGIESIPLLDLDEEERLRFTPSELKRYIDKVVKQTGDAYRTQIRETRSKAQARIRKSIDDANYVNGYIYSHGVWRSGMELLDATVKELRFDPLPPPRQRPARDYGKLHTEAENAKMKAAATAAVEAWRKQPGNTGADALAGLADIPWLASVDVMEVFIGDDPSFVLRDNAVLFNIEKDEFSGGAAECSVRTHKDHMAGYTLIYSVKTLDEAGSIISAITEKIGAPKEGTLPLADKAVTLKWDASKVSVQIHYVPPAGAEPGTLTFYAERKDASALIDQLPTVRRK